MIKERLIKIGKRYMVFRRNHPVLVGMADGLVFLAGGFYIAKRIDTPQSSDNLKITKAIGDIDEAIFTDLAVEIENLVLEEGSDEGVIERFYTVPFLKNGDPAQGTYNVIKQVKVLVRDTCN